MGKNKQAEEKLINKTPIIKIVTWRGKSENDKGAFERYHNSC